MENGSLQIRDLCDQYYIHKHKKLINVLDHTSRSLMMGSYLVHMNHIQLVYDLFSIVQHGLSADDVNRRDRQNWRSAQKLSFLRLQDCIKQIIDGYNGAPPNNSLKGTLTYFKVIWMYVEIFCSEVASPETRIAYSATVCHFLAIWHNFVEKTPGLTKTKHFITRETFSDVVQSCHFAVMLVCYMRDTFPGIPCRLDLTGTDVVEEFWSRNGQWVGNRHNYTFCDLYRNLSHMIRLDEIRKDPNAPEFAKPHPKQESIWNKKYTAGYQRADLRDYPPPGTEITAWCRGIKDAKNLARSVGMCPDNVDRNDDDDDDDDDDDNKWFFKPFENNIFKPDSSWDLDDMSDDRSSYRGQNNEETEVVSAGELVQQGLEMTNVFKNIGTIDEENDHNGEEKKMNPVVPTPACCNSGSGFIHKATLTEMLNEDPKLSKDRLKRVRQHQNYQGIATVKRGFSEEVSLFKDYVFLDRAKQSHFIGNIVRMQTSNIASTLRNVIST